MVMCNVASRNSNWMRRKYVEAAEDGVSTADSELSCHRIIDIG